MREINLTTPLDEKVIRSLNIGDNIVLSGTIFTARDMMHKYLCDIEPETVSLPFDINGGVLYHCGPIVRMINNINTVISAGPTTSERLEMYEPRMIKRFGLAAIIGKGGMGDATLDALKTQGCVYLQTISGAGVFLADRIKRVLNVWKLDEFGEPEAMWLLEALNFPSVVTMDSKGNSLHKDILNNSARLRDEIFS
jgi:fumarate hydratase class I